MSEDKPPRKLRYPRAEGLVMWSSLSAERQEEWIAETRAEGKCGAKPRGDYSDRQHPCRLPGSGINGRCTMKHGGATRNVPMPAGGKHSKNVSRLRGTHQKHASNPRILDPTEDVAWFGVRIDQLIEQLDGFDCPAFRERAVELFEDMRTAIASGEASAMQHALEDLGAWLTVGNAEGRAWREFLQVVSESIKLKGGISKVMLAGEGAVMRADVNIIHGWWIDEVVAGCSDSREAQAIIAKMSARAGAKDALKIEEGEE